MLMPPGLKVFIAVEPVDMRASFYRLASHVRGDLAADPQSGHLYFFLGKGRNLVKVLFWDRDGYCLFSKKLERGRFRLPVDIPEGVDRHEVDFATLTLLLEGIDLHGSRRRSPYRPPPFGGEKLALERKNT
jgi:transposase